MNISPNVITILIDDTKSVDIVYSPTPIVIPIIHPPAPPPVTAPGAPTNVLAELLPSAPNAPTNISVAKFDSSSVTVIFGEPTDNGGRVITSYTVTSTPDGHTASGPTSPMIVTSLRMGIPYTFTVHATNVVGNSPESAASDSIVIDNIADVPLQLFSTKEYSLYQDIVTDVPLELFSTKEYSLYQDVVTDINLQLFSTKEYSLYQDIVTDVPIELAGGIVSDTFKGRINNVPLATLSQGGLTLRQMTPATIPLATLSQGGLTLRQMTPATIPFTMAGATGVAP